MATTNRGEPRGSSDLVLHDPLIERMSNRELFRELVSQSERLVRDQVALARSEIRGEIQQAVTAGKMGAIGGVVGHVAFIVIAFAAVYLLGLALPLWVAAVIIGGALALAAAALIAAGRTKFKNLSLKPRETAETLGEDRRWAKETMRDVRLHRHASA